MVSDLHLGLEKDLASKGFRLPPYSQKMLDRMNSMAEKSKLNRVIVVGDVKHSIGKVQDIDWGIIPWFFETLLDIFQAVEIVPGNHDGGIRSLLPSRVKLHPADGDRHRAPPEGRGHARALLALAGGHRIKKHRDGAFALSV